MPLRMYPRPAYTPGSALQVLDQVFSDLMPGPMSAQSILRGLREHGLEIVPVSDAAWNLTARIAEVPEPDPVTVVRPDPPIDPTDMLRLPAGWFSGAGTGGQKRHVTFIPQGYNTKKSLCGASVIDRKGPGVVMLPERGWGIPRCKTCTRLLAVRTIYTEIP